jgi:hypothetical protein
MPAGLHATPRTALRPHSLLIPCRVAATRFDMAPIYQQVILIIKIETPRLPAR